MPYQALAHDLAQLQAEIKTLRDEVAALRDTASLFYEAGRADALGVEPRVPRPRHLSIVMDHMPQAR